MTSKLEIRASNLCKRYGNRSILEKISFEISGSETVALIGPSGGGKSTLLRCLNGLNTFDEGEIRIGEHVLSAASANGHATRQVRKQLGMVFQDFQLFPHLSAVQNVMEAPLRVLRMSRPDAHERAMGLLKQVGLAERAEAYPNELSGGQKQRVAIARALAMSPMALLCDEITSALDPELKCEVLTVLEDLKAKGMTLIMVTHEIGFARRAADRVMVLAGGSIIEEGPARDVIDSPKTERARLFLSRVLG